MERLRGVSKINCARYSVRSNKFGRLLLCRYKARSRPKCVCLTFYLFGKVCPIYIFHIARAIECCMHAQSGLYAVRSLSFAR